MSGRRSSGLSRRSRPRPRPPGPRPPSRCRRWQQPRRCDPPLAATPPPPHPPRPKPVPPRLPAPWPRPGRAVLAGICLAVAALKFRVGETDRMLAFGGVYAGQRDMDGRRTVTTALHTLVGNPLIHLKMRAMSVGPDFFDLVRQVEGGYRETLALDRGGDVTMDRPGVLAPRLDAIAGQYGINVSFSSPSAPMEMPDREVARFVLDDLTENAAKAAAGTVMVDLGCKDGRYLAVVSDDGPGFRAGAWMR